MATRTPKVVLTTLLTNLINGLKKNQPNGSFLIAGVTYTTAQLVKILQQILAAMAVVTTTKGAYQKALVSSKALSTQYGAVLTGLKQTLQIEYIDNPDLLADFGLTPRKPTGVKSPEVKAAAAVKAAATRQARGTKGPKAKLKITGATAPATPAEPTAPAGETPAIAAPIGATPVVTTPGH
jgi:hypothetical protein